MRSVLEFAHSIDIRNFDSLEFLSGEYFFIFRKYGDLSFKDSILKTVNFAKYFLVLDSFQPGFTRKASIIFGNDSIRVKRRLS